MSKEMHTASVKTNFVKSYNGYTAPKIVVDDTPIKPIADVKHDTVKIIGKIGSIKRKKSSSKPYLEIYESTISDESGEISAVWFNTPRLKYLHSGKQYIFLGKMTSRRGKVLLKSPIFTAIEDYKKWTLILDEELRKVNSEIL